jgi:hypothetical protein
MPLPFRQIHLDFHTSPHIPDVGVDFDGAEFVRTLKDAHVNSVTCFAKCHHGMSYYPTEIGVVHPHLKRDLLGEQIEACHSAGINVPVYISVVWDEHAAATHADWLQVTPDGKLAGRSPLGNHGWRFLCMNSPYIDYVAAQTEEVVRRYPVDGIFFDIVMETQPACVCNHCMLLIAELGLDPTSEPDLRHKARVVARRVMERLSALVRAHRPSATIFYNSRLRVTSDPEAGNQPELQYMTHIEIESLPSGGWGYNHFPLYVRYFQPLGLATLGMTARFHKTWADFGGLKTEAALEYECFRMVASGSACSIGDQLHPRGRLEAPVYERIGRVYDSVAQKEGLVAGAEPEVEIGVLVSSGAGAGGGRSSASDEGVLRMLLEEHHQFQFVDRDSDFSRYHVLIVPDEITFDPELAAKVRAYLGGGGSLLLSHRSGLAASAPDSTMGTGDSFALPEIGVEYGGTGEYTPSYLRLEEGFGRAGGASLPALDYVLYDEGCAVEAADGTEVLARIVRPYFNRTWQHFSSHNQTPQAELTPHAAVTRRGQVIYISHPIFRSYHRHGYPVYRQVVAAALRLLLPEPLLRADLPTSAEATLMRQENRRVLHLLHYAPQRRSADIDIVEDALPLLPTTVAVRVPEQPSRAYLAPTGTALDVEYDGAYAHVTLPLVQGHAMVVLE